MTFDFSSEFIDTELSQLLKPRNGRDLGGESIFFSFCRSRRDQVTGESALEIVVLVTTVDGGECTNSGVLLMDFRSDGVP